MDLPTVPYVGRGSAAVQRHAEAKPKKLQSPRRKSTMGPARTKRGGPYNVKPAEPVDDVAAVAEPEVEPKAKRKPAKKQPKKES